MRKKTQNKKRQIGFEAEKHKKWEKERERDGNIIKRMLIKPQQMIISLHRILIFMIKILFFLLADGSAQ